MTRPIQAELELLRREFLSMGNMVFDAISVISSAIMNNDGENVATVISNDKIIDGRENTIDNHCIKLWATQAPVAHDLRLLFCIIRSNNELERLGDHAKDMGRCLLLALKHGAMPLIPPIKTACQEILDVFDMSLQSYQKNDSALSVKALALCKAGKKRLESLNQEVIDLIKGETIKLEIAIELLTIGKHLQRMYAVIGNLCKNTIYLLEGDLVRHGGRQHPLTDA